MTLPNLDVDVLKTFLAIADYGTFTRAGEVVNKTQSAVSMQMKRLEEMLGRPVFVRDGRLNRLTTDGARLIDHARQFVALNEATLAHFMEPELSGLVRFGSPDDYGDRFLPEIIGRFAASHPRVQIEFTCAQSPKLYEQTEHGELDLALVTQSKKLSGGEVIRQERLVWAGSQRHNQHRAVPLPLALNEQGCTWRDRVLASLDQAGLAARIVISSNNLHTVRATILAGLAVAALPQASVIEGMRTLGEAEGFPDLGTFNIALITKPGSLSPPLQALRRHVVDSMGEGTHYSGRELSA